MTKPDIDPSDDIKLGRYDRALEGNLPLAPSDDSATRLARAFIGAGVDALASMLPGVGDLLKSVVLSTAMPWNKHKAARADECTLGLFDRLARLEAQQLRPEGVLDLFEDALFRRVNQPDKDRRGDIDNVLVTSIRRSSPYPNNRLFIRFADELPMQAIHVLDALDSQRDPKSMTAHYMELLAEKARLDRAELDDWLTFLRNQTLTQMRPESSAWSELLTTLGKNFNEFRKST